MRVAFCALGILAAFVAGLLASAYSVAAPGFPPMTVEFGEQ